MRVEKALNRVPDRCFTANSFRRLSVYRYVKRPARQRLAAQERTECSEIVPPDRMRFAARIPDAMAIDLMNGARSLIEQLGEMGVEAAIMVALEREPCRAGRIFHDRPAHEMDEL